MFKLLNDQLGTVAVVVGVGTVLAISRGSVLLPVYIGAVVIVCALIIANARRGAGGQDHGGASVKSGRVGSAFSYEAQWPVGRDLDLPRLHGFLEERGLATAIEGQKLLISRGSKLRTRLLGGYWVKVDDLPLSGELSVSSEGLRSGRKEVTLKLRDEMGVAIRDGRLGRQFDKSFADISERVHRAIASDDAKP